MNIHKTHIPFFKKQSDNLRIVLDTQNVDPMEALAVLYAVPNCHVSSIRKDEHTITCELTCDHADRQALMDLLLEHPCMTAIEIHQN